MRGKNEPQSGESPPKTYAESEARERNERRGDPVLELFHASRDTGVERCEKEETSGDALSPSQEP